MKIKNKLIALIASLLMLSTFSLAKDGPYAGIKASQIKIDFVTVDGINLNSLVENEFKALDAHIGYNIGNGFFELGYLNSDKGTKTGTSTSGGVTVTTTNFGYEFDGFRLGAGYNYNVGNNLIIKPFINYYDLKFTASGTISASNGSTTVTGKVSGSERDQAIDAGLGLDYVINNQSKIGISYSQFIDEFTDTKSTKVYSIGFSHQF